MNTIQGRTLESLRSVQAFLDANADRLAGIANSGQRKKLDGMVIELEGHVGAQSSSALASKGATQKHQSLRVALLRDHMAKIAAIAAAELPKVPELEVLKMPKGGTPSVERLRAAALGMAKAAAPYADVFVKAALPADFIDQLVTAANATIGSVGTRKQNRAAGAGATKGLKTTLSSARKSVRALDALVKSEFRDDPSMLAAWRTAKRVEKFTGAQQALITVLPIPAPTTTATPVAVPMAIPQRSPANVAAPSATI